MKFINNNQSIKASLGNGLGYKFKITGKSLTGKVNIVKKIIHPKFNLENKYNEFSEMESEVRINGSYTILYGFDYDYELVPGEWVFQVYYDNKKYLEKKFQVEVE